MSLSVKLFPLEGILTIMQAAAPLFRRCCPDPPHELVHLPSLLLHVDVSLRYFSTVDILLSALTNRPMFFRYNVSFTSEVTESMMNIDNHLGLQWLYGVPDRLVVTLARINSLREDFGICTDEKIIQELELEIGGFKSTVGTSTEPILSVGRLIVQECWRQTALAYLYMASVLPVPAWLELTHRHRGYVGPIPRMCELQWPTVCL